MNAVKFEDTEKAQPDKNAIFQSDSGSGILTIEPVAGRENKAGKRDLGEIFSEALEIYRHNPILIVPSLVPVSALVLGMLIFVGYLGLMAIFADGGFLALSFLASLLLFAVLMVVLIFLAEGASIEMIRQASMGDAADLSTAWTSTRNNLEPLLLTSILAGIMIALGYALFFIPGLILSFAFYFITQVVMIDGRSGLEALKASYRFVEANLSDCLIVVLASLAISAVLHSVPVIGPLLGLISLPYIYALATLLYLDRSSDGKSPQETQGERVEIV
ncbi:MAG: hypothetical protein BWY13_00064 [Euryarchaeota archaeon ADurb.Bin190]|nr:MAG: hypothetical protein BWY13_00064 [Euryarchaeota archaeon ADurb.Bin190]